MKSIFASVLLFASSLTLGVIASAQVEGPVATQALVSVDAKSTPPVDASALTVSVNDHKEPLTAWTQVAPGNAQVALLIDAGLRQSVGREINNLKQFVRKLPPGVQLLIGYMQYG